MFDVNVLGVLYLTQAAVRGMSPQASGHVSLSQASLLAAFPARKLASMRQPSTLSPPSWRA